MAKLDGNLEKRVLDVEKQLERRATNLEQWGDDIAEAINEVKDRVTTLEHGCAARPWAGYKYLAGLRRTASTRWWTFLLATETGSAVPQTQFIDRVVVLPGVL